MPTFSDARALAERVLADHLPQRWERSQAVAREALRVAGLDGVDRDALIQAAVLLDIGSSPVVTRSGFPPLDGARFLVARGYDARVAGLVAHHRAADAGAHRRALDAFRDDAGPTRDALWYCDVVVGPDGEPVDPEAALQGDDDVVVTRLRAAVERTRARLAAQP